MHHHEISESRTEYIKFAGVIAGITLLSVAAAAARGWGLESFMANFMGVFFVIFAAFKLVQLEMFSIAYSGYDIIAKRFKPWGTLFPFIELSLGIGYLLFGNIVWLNLTTIAITSLAGLGVLKELRSGSVIRCACLGTVIKLPLSKISFFEDFAMLAMAAGMIVL